MSFFCEGQMNYELRCKTLLTARTTRLKAHTDIHHSLREISQAVRYEPRTHKAETVARLYITQAGSDK